MNIHVPVRVISLRDMDVNWDAEWDQAIFRSGKDSNPELYLFDRVVEQQYRSPHKGVQKVSPCLVGGFTKAWRTDLALEILKNQGLRPTHPRVAFAVGEKRPRLHQELGVPLISVVSLSPCIFRVGENNVQFVTRTFISDVWRESRLVPRSYLFEGFCWIIAEEIQ